MSSILTCGRITNFPFDLMFDAARKYVYDRRRGLFETSVVICGGYAISRYVNERLEEVKEKVVRGRAAREAYVR
jgi:peroxin-3